MNHEDEARRMVLINQLRAAFNEEMHGCREADVPAVEQVAKRTMEVCDPLRAYECEGRAVFNRTRLEHEVQIDSGVEKLILRIRGKDVRFLFDAQTDPENVRPFTVRFERQKSVVYAALHHGDVLGPCDHEDWRRDDTARRFYEDVLAVLGHRGVLHPSRQSVQIRSDCYLIDIERSIGRIRCTRSKDECAPIGPYAVGISRGSDGFLIMGRGATLQAAHERCVDGFQTLAHAILVDLGHGDDDGTLLAKYRNRLRHERFPEDYA